MRKGKVWINRLMANRPITTDRRGEWDILLNCIKKSPAMPGFSFVCEWREKRFRTGRAVFSEWHVCFRFRCRFLYLGMTAVWRVSDLTKFPDRGCFKPVCLCRGCSDRPVRTVDNVCISKKRHRTPFCGARCRVGFPFLSRSVVFLFQCAEQHVVHQFDESCRVFQGTALGQNGLIE